MASNIAPIFDRVTSTPRFSHQIANQLNTIEFPTVTAATTVQELPRIRACNSEWLLEEWIHKKAARSRTSWVHSHAFIMVEFINDALSNNTRWFCRHCDAKQGSKAFTLTATSSLSGHLSSHGVKKPKEAIDDDNENDENSSPLTPTSTVLEMINKGVKRRREISNSVPELVFQRFKKKVIQWIVEENVALTAIESPLFRDLFARTELTSHLPHSGDTIRRWIMEDLAEKKAVIKRLIRDHSKSLFHLSFDLWTSPNAKSLLGVILHYMDDSYTNQTRLIALRRLPGRHKGENIGQILCQITEEYELTGRLGYFITDNADSNDKASNYVLRTLRPDIPVENYKKRRLRCWGHVMNLAAKAFLFGKDPRVFEVEAEVTRQLGYEEAELETWRRKGAIGKLHNLIVWVRKSTQRRDLFLSMATVNADVARALLNEDDDEPPPEPQPQLVIQPELEKNLMLVQDNKTRWNSAYMMMDRALKMRRSITLMIAACESDSDEDRRVPNRDHLLDEDWRVISEIHHILQPFFYQTKHLEGRAPNASHGAIWEALPSMEYLLGHMERLVTHYEDPNCLPSNPELANTPLSPPSRRHIQESIRNAWAKLDEYYKKATKHLCTRRQCGYTLVKAGITLKINGEASQVGLERRRRLWRNSTRKSGRKEVTRILIRQTIALLLLFNLLPPPFLRTSRTSVNSTISNSSYNLGHLLAAACNLPSTNTRNTTGYNV